MNCIPSIVDDVLAEIEAEFRARGPRPAIHGAVSNAQTLSVVRRQRGPEARACTAHALERFAKEAGA